MNTLTTAAQREASGQQPPLLWVKLEGFTVRHAIMSKKKGKCMCFLFFFVPLVLEYIWPFVYRTDFAVGPQLRQTVNSSNDKKGYKYRDKRSNGTSLNNNQTAKFGHELVFSHHNHLPHHFKMCNKPERKDTSYTLQRKEKKHLFFSSKQRKHDLYLHIKVVPHLWTTCLYNVSC